MGGFTNIIGDWHFWSLVIGYWVFSNAVGSMPLPGPGANPWYAWMFKFLNGLAANLSRAFASKIPGVDTGNGNGNGGNSTGAAAGK